MEAGRNPVRRLMIMVVCQQTPDRVPAGVPVVAAAIAIAMSALCALIAPRRSLSTARAES